MLKVYFTVDVEIWCDNWVSLDAKFNSTFQKYIYGPTKKGEYGLPYILRTLNDYGLVGVFFVEPLFSLRFGSDPLVEITELIMESNQSVELHLHTEWVDEIKKSPLPLPQITEKLQHLRYFDLDQQKKLIGIGKELLIQSGVKYVNAFRAGNFGFNVHTLSALKHNKILIDSSYNATMMGLDSGLMSDQILTEPVIYDGVCEAPMTVYFDWYGHLRHMQLCACSFSEMEYVLWKALEEGRHNIMILAHGSELLDKSNSRPCSIVVKRFEKLCNFLDKNRDCFSIEDFSSFSPDTSTIQRDPIKSPIWKTGLRIIENAVSRYK